MAPIYGESNLYIYEDVKGLLWLRWARQYVLEAILFSMIVRFLLNMIVVSLDITSQSLLQDSFDSCINFGICFCCPSGLSEQYV